MFEHRSFGTHLKLSVHGASHAPELGFTLENFPAAFPVNTAELRNFMERRAPGRDALSTARRESDAVEFRAGVMNGVTTGGTIVGAIANADFRPGDYGNERTIPRPGHADFGQWVEFGRIPTGGGANSGRLTAALCAAGGLCRQWLTRRGISVTANVAAIGGCVEGREQIIARARDEGDSVGGTVVCEVTGLRPGLGGALFAGVESELSAAIFAIPGVKGVAFGNGFAASSSIGSENNDPFVVADGQVRTESNRHGGILGGRTSGLPLVFTVAFKPTPTIFKPLPSVDLATMTAAVCAMKGRHDPCLVRRAVPVVEAMAAFVLMDLILATEAAVPRIVLTLTGRTLAEAHEQLAQHRMFCDGIELRVDLLQEGERAHVEGFLATVGLPTIVTFRRASDGGAFEGAEAERVAFFRGLLASSVLDRGEFFVDFEDDFRSDELASAARTRHVRIVRSVHCFDGPVGDVAACCRRLVAGTDEIAKVAFMPRSCADVCQMFRDVRDLDVPHVVCAMGALGIASRVLAAQTGSLWTYASAGGLEGLGHLTPFDLVRTYRLRTATRGFALYGVTGWPLKATRSPELHNAAFLASDRDAVMAPFPAETAAEVVAAIRLVGLRGLAVTIPHKESVMPLLDEISPDAQAIGAVNTIAVRDGRLVGFNTDADGFAEALMHFLGGENLNGRRVAVLGSGGAAKAVVFALKRLGARVEVFHRQTPGPGFDVLVNATPVDPIPDYTFSGAEAVYDLVYLPEETPLIARAKAAGCRTENGFSMLVAQARRQREIWGQS